MLLRMWSEVLYGGVMTDVTDAQSTVPTAMDTARPGTGELLFQASFWCALAGWLPAVSGQGWCLLVIAGVSFGASVWLAWREESRRERCFAEELADLDATRRPLRQITAAEREALARHRTAP